MSAYNGMLLCSYTLYSFKKAYTLINAILIGRLLKKYIILDSSKFVTKVAA